MRLRAKLERKKLRRSKIELEFDAIVKEIRVKLLPFEDIERYRIGDVKKLVEKLEELQEEYKKIGREIEDIEGEIGE